MSEKRDSGMVPIDKCFQCGQPVFVAEIHLERNRPYPSKYPVMFCDHSCRTQFLIYILEYIMEEL